MFGFEGIKPERVDGSTLFLFSSTRKYRKNRLTSKKHEANGTYFGVPVKEFCKDNKEFIKKHSTHLQKSIENIKIQLTARAHICVYRKEE